MAAANFGEALEKGYGGNVLRRLAGLANPIQGEIRLEEIDSAFREMGVAAPIAKDRARLIFAAELADRTIRGLSNVFDRSHGLDMDRPIAANCASIRRRRRHTKAGDRSAPGEIVPEGASMLKDLHRTYGGRGERFIKEQNCYVCHGWFLGEDQKSFLA